MKYDLVVLGGGLSGVAAAVRASQMGLKTILIEQSGALGGAINNNLVFPFMNYFTNVNNERILLSGGIFTQMRNEADKYREGRSPNTFSPEGFKIALDDLCEEANVSVLFHAKMFAVKTENKKITSVDIATKSGVMTVYADNFIDCTGDGDLFFLAGCDYQLGRIEDNLCQPMTTCFRVSNVNIEQFKKDADFLQKKYKELQKKGEILNPREDILYFYHVGEGVIHFNTTRIIKLDPTNTFDLSVAEKQARKQVWEMFDFLKKYSSAFEKSTVISVAPDIGVRESRMLKGTYILTAEDIVATKKFSDRIALGNYDIDIHSPDGAGTSHYYFKAGEYYTIPYRCLVPEEFDNLLVAGRCVSATHEAQASIRIMPICATMGEAAGIAAGVMVRENATNKTVNVENVQNEIRNFGGILEI